MKKLLLITALMATASTANACGIYDINCTQTAYYIPSDYCNNDAVTHSEINAINSVPMDKPNGDLIDIQGVKTLGIRMLGYQPIEAICSGKFVFENGFTQAGTYSPSLLK